MKKYLAVFLVVLFVLSFAVAAFAEDKPEITIGGELRVRGWYVENINDNTATYLPGETESQAWYDQRLRLNVNAKIADNTSAFVQLESTNEKEARNSDTYTWGSWNQKPSSELTFRQAYIQHSGSGLLGVPVGIKVGHMLLALGEKQFLDHTKFGDDAIVLWTDPMKELHIGLVTAKAFETNKTKHGDDVDAYMLLGTYKIDKDNTIGLNYTLIKSDASNLDSVGVDSLDFQNLGLHANGNISGLSYAFEGDIQFGDLQMKATEDASFKGYGLMLKLGYMLDPVNIRGSFAMGSGDDDATDNDNSEFQTTMGRDMHYTFIYEYTVKSAANYQKIAVTNDPGGRATGIANTTYFNLGIDYSPVKDLNMSLDGFMLQATETAGIPNVLKPGKEVDDNLGWEVDFKTSYKIVKNLTYFVQAGYFDSGDFYQDVMGKDQNKGVTQLMHGLQLDF